MQGMSTRNLLLMMWVANNQHQQQPEWHQTRVPGTGTPAFCHPGLAILTKPAKAEIRGKLAPRNTKKQVLNTRCRNLDDFVFSAVYYLARIYPFLVISPSQTYDIMFLLIYFAM